MSTEAIEQARTNLEAMRLATADAEQARRVVLLWQRPTIPDHEIPEALSIPPTLWSNLKAQGDGPPLFQLGRRLFCRTADLRKWLDQKASAGQPDSKRLRAKAEAS